MEFLLQDLRHAARTLGRTPGFTVVALATLALAIGATTAVFSLVNGVLVNPLGFTRPERLLYVGTTDPRGAAMSVSPQDLQDYRDQTHSFTGMAAVDGGRSMSLDRAPAPAVRISAARVGASFFSLLGIGAQLGRTFAAGEDAPGAAKVVVLSAGAWQRYFGADPAIVGRPITLDGNPYQVVGIAPPRFTFPDAPDLWFPAAWRSWEIGDEARGLHSVHAIARLRDGATLASARRDLQSVAARIARDFPKYDAGVGATATPLRDQIVGDVERPLWSMLGAVVLVLLIACANVANLLIVRAGSRGPEVAVRTALGAGRHRLLQQFVTESMLLALAGAALGTLLASWIVGAVVALAPAGLPRIQEVTIDGRVLAFGALVAVLAGLAFGILPVLHLSRWDVASVLRSGARGNTSGGGRTRSALVLAELALGTMLLVGAGLLIRSFERLTSVDPGFRADHVIVFDVALSGPKYQYDAATNAYTDEVQTRLAAIPGTERVAVTADRPFDPNTGFSASTSFTVDGEPRPAPGSEPESRVLPVSPSFFAAMGMTLIRGRTFTGAEDRVDAVPVVVINEALAQRYFPGQDPIGKHLTFGLSHTVTANPADSLRARGEIVGIVRTVQQSSLAAKPEPATYFPYHTLPFGPSFVVRTAADPASIEREIRRQVAAVDATMPIYGLETMDAALAESVSQPRFYTMLLTAFASVALLLTALGIYGVISYAVGQRTREFGIRIALGATTHDVTRLVVRRGAVLTVVGLAIGLLGAALATRVIRGLLFGVQPLDAASFVAACVVLGAVATLASWLPARRAARVDPVAAMRAE